MTGRVSGDAREDVLLRAVRALRAHHDLALAAGTDPTWSRVIGDVRRARRRRRWVSTLALQLVVWLGATAVWAAVTGRLAAVVAPAAPVAPPSGDPPPARSHARRPRVVVALPEPAAETQHPVQDPADDPPPPAEAAAPRTPPPPRIAHAPRVAATAPPPLHAVDPLYVEAHRLHFERRDFGAALAAWDRYLAGGGDPLAAEGRYNRAIALAHLGRHAEAIEALRPFADGAHAGYRQKEAKALIERLGAASPP
jgi:hypothetical protein